jgi:hypothetical protein
MARKLGIWAGRSLALGLVLGMAGLGSCPQGESAAQQAANQAALAARAAQLPGGWPVAALQPTAGFQQVKLTPQVLAAIEGRSGSAPLVVPDGYAIAGQPFQEAREDDALIGLTGKAASTDAADATDRARPRRRGQYWLIAGTAGGDWEQLVEATDKQLAAAGLRRIEGSEGPEGELARWINADETALAVLAQRVPRDDHVEYGLTQELFYMACTLERRKPPPESGEE